ncbi:MAG: alpha/beta hydrolase family protein [bacterium]
MILLLSVFFILVDVSAQKKIIDHTVFDGWESIGEKRISNNGEWIAYTVDVQEGDSRLVLQRTDSSFAIEFPRGYTASFTAGSQFLIFKIKPYFAEIRKAKIAKKKEDQFPKDSLGIFDLVSRSVEKIENVISYSLPKESGEWLAYQHSVLQKDSSRKTMLSDTLKPRTDTAGKIRTVILEHVPDKKQKRKLTSKEKDEGVFETYEDRFIADQEKEIKRASKLVIQSLSTKKKINFEAVRDYLWSENGKVLLYIATEDSVSRNNKYSVSIWRSIENRVDTLVKGCNEVRNMSVDKNGYQIAFVAQVDSMIKSAQKFYKLFYWKNGERRASIIVDKYTIGMPVNWTVNEHYQPFFSHSGSRLFIGTSPVKPMKDTSLIDLDLVKLDVWHYADEDLQSVQLKSLDKDLKNAYLAMVDLQQQKFVQLADIDVPTVLYTTDGDGQQFIGFSERGKRKSVQWDGFARKDVYSIDPLSGFRKLIISNLNGVPKLSSHSTYIHWYDMDLRHYFVHSAGKNINISKKVILPLYDEEHDMPSAPSPYGTAQWHDQDSALYVYDRYDIWKLDPKAIENPINITKAEGRAHKVVHRHIPVDPDERSFKHGQQIALTTFNESNKHAGISSLRLHDGARVIPLQSGPFSMSGFLKSKYGESYFYVKENEKESPNVFYSNGLHFERRMSSINPNQSLYNWLTAELVTWKTYDGKTATGIVYKPEDFKPGKKYPMITYFYERLSDRRYKYLPPAPPAGSMNIPSFVSRGYIVFLPDIHYTVGHPGESSYNYVVSGVRSIIRKGWVDSTKLGIQGQSWGAYQVAYIITRTNMFAAAWASAPVSNMFSAYGGIRWESGMNRQFQYEKSQSRIGATIWQKPALYEENSPLFHLQKVQTPLAIVANDNDGAVPWYQGIELFTAMRRLDKKVWMLNYNGEAHNLVERKNRKDLYFRQQQFFDWLLKNENPTDWLDKGIKATDKGITWGIERSN